MQVMNNGKKNQTFMCVREEDRPALWLGRIEYKLNRNTINLHSGCTVQADREDK